MLKITQDDLQCINDAGSLMHFLNEKLRLSIPEKTVDKTDDKSILSLRYADPAEIAAETLAIAAETFDKVAIEFTLANLRLGDGISQQIVDCHWLSVGPVTALENRHPFLIRFKTQQNYSAILRDIGTGLQKHELNRDFFFISAYENYRPFAFAVLRGDLQVVEWTEKNTSIHTAYEHEFPASLFPPESDDNGDDTKNGNSYPPNDNPVEPIADPTRSEALLVKLKKTPTLLGGLWDIHGGITTGCDKAYVIEDSIREQLIAEHFFLSLASPYNLCVYNSRGFSELTYVIGKFFQQLQTC